MKSGESGVSRRRFIASGLGGAALLTSSAARAGSERLAAPAIIGADLRPNILFIAVDDLNDWVEPLGGYDGVKTPNFNRLARMSRVYTRAYSPVPTCNGARTAILFGLHPHHTGVYTNVESWTDSSILSSGQKSLPRVLLEAGYFTTGCGKIFHRGWSPNGSPIWRDGTAWSEYQVCGSPAAGCDVPRPAEYEAADRSEKLDHDFIFGRTDLKLEAMADVQRVSWFAQNVLGAARTTPFFGAIGLEKPHLPFTVPKEFFALYPRGKLHYPPGVLDPAHNTVADNRDVADLPEGGLNMLRQRSLFDHELITGGKHDYWKDVIRAYLATISYTDYCLGIVLDGLLRGPNASNTIVILWSDHGWQLGEKLAWQKRTLWERATRVPFFIGGAVNGQRIAAGRDGALVSCIDLFPTICDLALGKVPNKSDLGKLPLDGVSIRHNVLRGGQTQGSVLSTWYLENGPEIENDHEEAAVATSVPALDARAEAKLRNFAVRNERYRYIKYGDGSSELYDHDVDPYEFKNLMKNPSKREKDIVRHLTERMPRPRDCMARGA